MLWATTRRVVALAQESPTRRGLASLSLYDAITHGQIGDTLQTLTRKNWGRFVDAGELISSLSLPGKYGDMARRLVIGN